MDTVIWALHPFSKLLVNVAVLSLPLELGLHPLGTYYLWHEYHSTTWYNIQSSERLWDGKHEATRVT